MPSKDSIEIASIFDEIVANNLKYCCLCLRTEKERKLVDATHFTKCLSILGLQTNDFKTIYKSMLQTPAVKICYVCESESTRAYTLFQAINFARIMNQWFKDIASKIKYKSEIPTHLDRHINKQRPYLGARPQPAWWRRLRARCALVQTETLVVSDTQEEDSDVVEQPPAPCPPPARPPPRTADLDSIVIIDDDDDPLDITPPPLTRAPVPQPIPTPKVVPLERLLDSSNTNPKEVAIIPNDNIPKKNLTGFILHPFVMGPDGRYRIPGTTLENGQGTTLESHKKVQQGADIIEIEPLDFESDQINISGVQTLSDGILVDEDGQEKRQEDKKRDEVVKQPVMNGSRIDWEDKIPMDVISFVDASDPLFNMDSSTQTPSRKRHKNNIIDLS